VKAEAALTTRDPQKGQVFGHCRWVVPHLTQAPPFVHWLVVGQLLVTPSQVTDFSPTLHVLVPVQVSVWEVEVQPISQGGYGYGQTRLVEQALLQFTEAVHCCAPAADARPRTSNAAATAGRNALFMGNPPFRWRKRQCSIKRVLRFGISAPDASVQDEDLRKLSKNCTWNLPGFYIVEVSEPHGSHPEEVPWSESRPFCSS